MSLFNIFTVAGSAMTAQNQRLNVVASNLANADSAASSSGQPYRAKQVVFASTPFAMGSNPDSVGSSTYGVRVASVVEDQSPMKMVHDPAHPMANEEGYVALPIFKVVVYLVYMFFY